ncbi:MAG: TonB-dependent receptor [Salinivirgaceae bacterium]
MRRILFATAIIVSTLSAFGQPRHSGAPMIKKGIMGRVIDAQTENPVEYANVALFSSSDSTLVNGTVSNEKGFFKIDNVENGTYNMRIKFIGYQSHRLNKITISDDNPVIRLKALKLTPADVALDEVNITARQEEVMYKIDKRVVNVSENIAATGGTAVDALENTPGVEVDIDGNVSIRGSSNFTVLIDGKPTAMEGSEALQQIPASSIQEIEIITNPSAKYDPDGLTGILNIILKKDMKGGFNGIVSASAGNKDRYDASANLNYRKNKINLVGGYSFRQGRRGGEGESYYETYKETDTLFRNEIGDRGRMRSNHTIKAGIDYDFNDRNLLSVSGNYRIGERERFNESFYTSYSILNPDLIKTFSKGENTDEDNSYEISGVYVHKFEEKDHEIRIMGTHSTEAEIEEAYTYMDTLNIENTLIEETLTETTEDHIHTTAQVDYTLPLGSNKLETGAKSSLRKIDYQQSGDIFNPDPAITANDFRYLEDIHAMYAMFSGPIGGFEYQLGLRGEYSRVETEQLSTNDKNVNEIFTVYPTLHVSYEINEANKLMAGYSRRVNRPRTYFLNPYEERSDAYTIRKGNPLLDPEYAHSIELNYLKYIGKAFVNASVYYRQTDNKISRVQDILNNNTILLTFDNVDKESSLGAEISGRNKFTKWLSINASYSFFRYTIDAVDNGLTESYESFNHKVNGNANISFSRNASLQMFAMYYSPTVTSQGEREGFYFTGFGYKHMILDRRLTVSARVRNPFGNFEWNFTSRGPGYENQFIRRPDFPVFYVGLTYRINEGFKRRNLQNGDRNGTSEDFNEGMTVD